MTELEKAALMALEKLCGTADDPHNGWRGTGGTDVLFACEYCGAKHEDCTKIDHTDSCPIPTARDAIYALTQALATTEPVTLGPLAKRNIYDAIRGAYDLGYNDARNARTAPGDSAPGYDGRSVEEDHGSALFNLLSKRLNPATTERKGEPVGAFLGYTYQGEIDCSKEPGRSGAFWSCAPDDHDDAIPVYAYTSPQVPEGLDLHDLTDRLVAISAAVADSDDRAAQAMLSEALRMLDAARKGE